MSKRVYTPVIDSVVARFSDGIRYPNIEADGELIGTISSRWWTGWALERPV